MKWVTYGRSHYFSAHCAGTWSHSRARVTCTNRDFSAKAPNKAQYGESGKDNNPDVALINNVQTIGLTDSYMLDIQ